MRARWILGFLLVLGICAIGWWRFQGGTATALGKAAHAQTAAILAIGPRPPGSAGLESVRAHVRKELEGAGWRVQAQEFERSTPQGPVRFVNVRARFAEKSVDPWQTPPTGVLCAHLDSKYFADQHFLGADDAASACAAIIEMAKHLAEQQPEQAKALELVFFDGEESFGPSITPQDGLYGSRHYANFWRTQAVKPRFGILLDMIGHDDLSIKIPSDSPEHLKEKLFAAAKAENVSSRFGTAAGPIIDDHVPLNFAGIPTIDVIGDFSRFRWWHTPADEMKIVSAESLGISMRVTLRMLDDLL